MSRLNRAARGLSIRQRLTLIVLAVAIPLLALSAAIVWRLDQRERETRRDAIMYASRSILSAVDAQLDKYIAAAQTLARSPMLERDDLAAFRDVAERALPGLSGSWVALADARGQQVVNTLVSAQEPLPRIAPEVLADEVRAFETKQIRDLGCGHRAGRENPGHRSGDTGLPRRGAGLLFDDRRRCDRFPRPSE